MSLGLTSGAIYTWSTCWMKVDLWLKFSQQVKYADWQKIDQPVFNNSIKQMWRFCQKTEVRVSRRSAGRSVGRLVWSGSAGSSFFYHHQSSLENSLSILLLIILLNISYQIRCHRIPPSHREDKSDRYWKIQRQYFQITAIKHRAVHIFQVYCNERALR